MYSLPDELVELAKTNPSKFVKEVLELQSYLFMSQLGMAVYQNSHPEYLKRRKQCRKWCVNPEHSEQPCYHWCKCCFDDCAPKWMFEGTLAAATKQWEANKENDNEGS